jgi:hypothetical protein
VWYEGRTTHVAHSQYRGNSPPEWWSRAVQWGTERDVMDGWDITLLCSALQGVEHIYSMQECLAAILFTWELFTETLASFLMLHMRFIFSLKENFTGMNTAGPSSPSSWQTNSAFQILGTSPSARVVCTDWHLNLPNKKYTILVKSAAILPFPSVLYTLPSGINCKIYT